MESGVATNRLPKPSFAKVAAMAVSTEQKAMLATRHMDSSQFSLPTDAALAQIPVRPLPAVQHLAAKTGNHDMQSLNEAVSFLHVDDSNSKGSWKGTDTNGSLKVDVAVEDDQTQLSNSSTKPASLDGKSVASGTTFALDEKESLRPDDSASVKAAEEEESFSGPASGAPSSRVGSEAGSRAFRDQFYEISERMVVPSNRAPVVNRFGVPDIKEEDSPGAAPSSLPVASDPSMPIDTPFRGMATPYGFAQAPDEKLLEALESPKDRLFLLKLEQDVISFVRDSKDPILDLPPCNSFCRLLAHKLADYYYLTHFVDNAVSAVRLYRTPFCRLPPSLTSISNPPTTGSTPPPNAPAVKIMRRAGVGPFKQKTTLEGNTAASSTDASKETSDVGGDSGSGSDGGRNHVQSPTESTTAKEKTAMTREEREAKYKEARERIFKGFDESDVAETNSGPEESKEPSRSSSTSGRKKTKQQKNAQDDGFEARSQFNAYYPTMQYVSPNFVGTGQDTPVYNPYGVSTTNIGTQAAFLSSRVGQQYNSSFQQMPAPGPQFQPGPQQPFTTGFNSYGQGFGQPTSLGYNQVVSNQYNPVPPQPSMASQRSSAMSSPAMNNFAQPAQLQPQALHSQWSQHYYQSPYQGQIAQQQSPSYQPQQHHSSVHPPCSVPYPYGQLPSHPGRPNYQNQHPLPGSFNRQAFNPKTQSFVPGSGFPANPTLGYGSQPYTTNTSTRGQGHPHPSQAPMNMPRQALHNTYPTSFTVPPPVVPISSKTFINHSTTGQSPQTQGQSSLSKWGTPSHLPPKPPPPQMPNFMDSQRSLPPNIYAAAAAQANGQNTQSIQHGVSANGSGNNLPNQNTGIKIA